MFFDCPIAGCPAHWITDVTGVDHIMVSPLHSQFRSRPLINAISPGVRCESIFPSLAGQGADGINAVHGDCRL